jgi:hypothetical protein
MVTLFAFRIHMLNPWQKAVLQFLQSPARTLGRVSPLKESALLKKLKPWGEALAKRDVTLSNVGRKRFGAAFYGVPTL